MNRPEQALQREVVRLLRMVCDKRRWTAIERANRKTLGGIQKAMGANEGWPDLIFILDDGRMAAIELKRPDGRGRLSEAQIAWREMAETLPMGGYAVCKNVPEVFKQLRAWQFPGAERVITF